MTDVFDLRCGGGSLIVSIPHDGRRIPEEIAARMTEAGRAIPDTDWHVRALYDFLGDIDATVIAANYSRYVVDLNRPPDDAPMYPGRFAPGLAPVETFAQTQIYRDGLSPDAAEVDRRREAYWRPYHNALAVEIERIKRAHGRALLWDAHSIPSRVPALFAGALPALNLGTADGAACSADRAAAAFRIADESVYTSVIDGRFKGGYITRHYGRPAERVEALQLEIAQSAYMDEANGAFDEKKAAALRPVIRDMMKAFAEAQRRVDVARGVCS